MNGTNRLVILGVFVADCAFRSERLPRMGETVLGSGFTLGPGGKGSNQAVAAARLGAEVTLVTRLGHDGFAEMAARVWAEAGVTPVVIRVPESYTGAAYIFIDAGTGENAIVICAGAGATIEAADLDAQAAAIGAASVFMTQLEQPLPAARRGLEIARAAGVTTILNPAPAQDLPDALLALCDFITPNETEAEALTGIRIANREDAARAGRALLARGAAGAVITLGAAGALLLTRGGARHVPAVPAGAVVETTGAGDAFNGGFATALARGLDPYAATRYGCAAAGISVTRAGTALSMPQRAEVEALLTGTMRA